MRTSFSDKEHLVLHSYYLKAGSGGGGVHLMQGREAGRERPPGKRHVIHQAKPSRASRSDEQQRGRRRRAPGPRCVGHCFSSTKAPPKSSAKRECTCTKLHRRTKMFKSNPVEVYREPAHPPEETVPMVACGIEIIKGEERAAHHLKWSRQGQGSKSCS